MKLTRRQFIRNAAVAASGWMILAPTNIAISEPVLYVGRRGIEDKKKVGIPGKLIKPGSRSDTLILFACGIQGKHHDYYEHFGKLLGNEFNVYITELRSRGLEFGDTLKADHYQIDNQLRDIVEAEKVIYIGHSMGMSVSVASKNEYGLKVDGFYGICAYPSFGDSRTSDEDINSESIQQRAVNIAEVFDFGPLAARLKDQKILEPSRFAIGGIDEVLNTKDRKVAKRFQNYFKRYQNSSSQIFEGKNHCFNQTLYDFAPFNKNDPNILINDILNFVYDIKC